MIALLVSALSHPVLAQAQNTNGGACPVRRLADPAAEALASVRRGDLTVYMTQGFAVRDIYGVYCPSGRYDQLQTRGGPVTSDMIGEPTRCPEGALVNGADMEAYNRAVAATPQFQKATQCRAITYCEARYDKLIGPNSGNTQLDPRCPNNANILRSIAVYGTAAQLKAALSAYDTHSPAGRDRLTIALVDALMAAKWEAATVLLDAGADVNGRLNTPHPGREPLTAPIAAAVDQNVDRASKISKAHWLLSRGADFRRPEAHRALTAAASLGDMTLTRLLLQAGASPNGGLGKAELDRRAHLAINDGMPRTSPKRPSRPPSMRR